MKISTKPKLLVKPEVGLYANSMNKAEDKVEVANKTPSEVVAEVFRK